MTEVGPGREWSAEPSAAVSTLQRECSYPVFVDDGVIVYHDHRWSVNTSAWWMGFVKVFEFTWFIRHVFLCVV